MEVHRNPSIIQYTSTHHGDPNRREKKGVVYAIFETEEFVQNYSYMIYEIDPQNDAIGGEQIRNLGPILTFTSNDLPRKVFWFSIDSRLYCSGGYRHGDGTVYKTSTFMIDFDSELGYNLIEIANMNLVKNWPYVFGPFDDKMFYVFDGGNPEAFEMFNSESNEWSRVEVPPFIRGGLPAGMLSAPSAFDANTIWISPRANAIDHSYVFCTRSRTWRTEPWKLPLRILKAHPIVHEFPNFRAYLSLVKNEPNDSEEPMVFLFTKPLPDGRDLLPFAKHTIPVRSIPVRGLFDHLKRFPNILGGFGSGKIVDFYCLNDNSALCIVRETKRGFGFIQEDQSFVIDLCSLSFTQEMDLHMGIQIPCLWFSVVKDNRTLTYTPFSQVRMSPRHFFYI